MLLTLPISVMCNANDGLAPPAYSAMDNMESIELGEMSRLSGRVSIRSVGLANLVKSADFIIDLGDYNLDTLGGPLHLGTGQI